MAKHASELIVHGNAIKTFTDAEKKNANAVVKVNDAKALKKAKHYLEFLAAGTKCTFCKETFPEGDVAAAAVRYEEHWARALYQPTPDGIIIMEGSVVSLYAPMEAVRAEMPHLKSDYDKVHKARKYVCSPAEAKRIKAILASEHVILEEAFDGSGEDSEAGGHITADSKPAGVPAFVDSDEDDDANENNESESEA